MECVSQSVSQWWSGEALETRLDHSRSEETRRVEEEDATEEFPIVEEVVDDPMINSVPEGGTIYVAPPPPLLRSGRNVCFFDYLVS